MTVLPNPTYTRIRLLGQAPQLVGCDRSKRGCGAPVGEYCRSSGGYQNSTVGFHAPRRRAFEALGLSEDEQYERMLAITEAQWEQQRQARERLASVTRLADWRRGPDGGEAA